MQAYERYSKFTREYPAFQGLRMIPVSIIILINGLRMAGVSWLGRQGDFTIILPLFLAAVVLWFLTGWYYQRTFGRVEPLERTARQKITEIATLAGWVAVIVLENGLYELGVNLRISLIELTIGAVFAINGWRTARWYPAAVGVVCILLSILPLALGVSLGNPLFGTFGAVFSIFFALATVCTALLDHRRLVQMLKGLDGDNRARAD